VRRWVSASGVENLRGIDQTRKIWRLGFAVTAALVSRPGRLLRKLPIFADPVRGVSRTFPLYIGPK